MPFHKPVKKVRHLSPEEVARAAEEIVAEQKDRDAIDATATVAHEADDAVTT